MIGNVQTIDKGPGFGIRHVQVFLIFALMTLAEGMIFALSVAIVAMTDKSAGSNPDIPTYEWNNKSVILSSFYWGYILLQVVAGEIGRSYGTKKILIVAMFGNSVAFMLIPLMADTLGSYGVMGCRMVQGIFQGFLLPCAYNFCAKWVPETERSRLNAIAHSGAPLGSVIALSVTGFISSTSIGWPWSFYLYGIAGFAWIILWDLFAADTPAEHSSITDEERNFIEKSLANKGTQWKKMKAPWKAIFTSIPAWAYIATHILHTWGLNTMLTEIPQYISKVMKFDIKKNGVLSAAPNLISFFLGLVISYISDYVVNSQYISRGPSRKIFTSISNLGPAAALIAIGFLSEDAKALSVTLLIVLSSLNSAGSGGFLINPFDIAPNLAGNLVACASTLSTVASILAPLTVQIIVTDETDRSQWRIIFVISVMTYIASTIVYLLFSSSEVQWWNSETGLNKRNVPKFSNTEESVKT